MCQDGSRHERGLTEVAVATDAQSIELEAREVLRQRRVSLRTYRDAVGGDVNRGGFLGCRVAECHTHRDPGGEFEDAEVTHTRVVQFATGGEDCGPNCGSVPGVGEKVELDQIWGSITGSSNEARDLPNRIRISKPRRGGEA